MKKPRSKTFKTVLKKPTEFEKSYERRMRVELELRSVTEKLRRAHEWLPLLAVEKPHKKPAAVLQALRKRHLKLLGKIKEFRQKGIGEFYGRKPLPDLPRPGLPDKDKMRQMFMVKRLLEELRVKTDRPMILADQEEPSCPAWTDVFQSRNLVEYPSIEWSHDEDATFAGDFYFDPDYDIQRGIVTFRGWVTNPAPFNWPIIEEEHDWAQLMKCAALEFNIPPPACDAYIFYEVPMVLALSPYIDARDYLLVAHAILYEQPDASTGAPSSLSDFERIGQGFWIDPNTELSLENRIEQIPHESSFFVRQGVASKVHIGFTWNLSISSGEGGTSCGCWDQLVLFRPNGEDIWGLKATIVPA